MEIKDMGFGDFCAVNYWLELRGEKAWEPSQVPAMAWVISEGDQLIACAFIRKVEGGFGQLDGLATNLSLPGALRHEAIDLIVKHALDAAYASGIKSVYALSVDESTISRSLKHGFVPMPHTLIVHSRRRN